MHIMNRIYLDNAATTALAPEVIDAMVEVMKINYGNPSSNHSVGQEAKALIEKVRTDAANYLKVSPEEIIFTSCGTESNNMILKSCVHHLGVQRIITSPLEHKCVAESVLELKKIFGVEVVYLRPDKKGNLHLNDLEKALESSTKKTLVSLMHANNEIGNLLDLEKTSEICQKYGAFFHSDTVQTIGHFDLDFSKIRVDFAACSAHKFHGPKGSGFAFVRKSSRLKGIISGGPQEQSLRAGTENVAGIVGLGKALELAMDHLENNIKSIAELKEHTISKLTAAIPEIKFNGRSSEADQSLYTVLSVLLPFKDPTISLKLDREGISISQGSACSSGASKPSMVMMMVLDEADMENGTPLRISFSHHTTVLEIDRFVEVLEKISMTHQMIIS